MIKEQSDSSESFLKAQDEVEFMANKVLDRLTQSLKTHIQGG